MPHWPTLFKHCSGGTGTSGNMCAGQGSSADGGTRTVLIAIDRLRFDAWDRTTTGAAAAVARLGLALGVALGVGVLPWPLPSPAASSSSLLSSSAAAGTATGDAPADRPAEASPEPAPGIDGLPCGCCDGGGGGAAAAPPATRPRFNDAAGEVGRAVTAYGAARRGQAGASATAAIFEKFV